LNGQNVQYHFFDAKIIIRNKKEDLFMVIQPNMSSKAITEVWDSTNEVFRKHGVPISEVALETIFDTNTLNTLLSELNHIVGSSTSTCIEGG
jgi:hypothetical protein